MIGRLLCLVGFHDWIIWRYRLDLQCYVLHCDRHRCRAMRLDR